MLGFPNSSVGKESACNAGDPVSFPHLGRSAGEGIGYPLQYSCLENPMDGHFLQAVSKKYTFSFIFTCCILTLLPFFFKLQGSEEILH